MPATLYKRQRQVADFLAQYIQQHGYSPTLREIAEAINVTSLATVHEHLEALEKKGVIKRFEGVVRGVELIDERVGGGNVGLQLPIMGYIAAGAPIEPYSDPNALISVSPQMISGKHRAYVLQVKGQSMIDDGILDGDYVVVEEKDEVNNGDIVVALLDNGLATLKKFFREATRVRLEPANAKMQPIYATRVRIQGKVVGIVRRFSD